MDEDLHYFVSVFDFLKSPTDCILLFVVFGFLVRPQEQSITMRVSEIVSLTPGVLQLEEGCCEWEVDGATTALISIAGVHTELRANSFREEDQVL